jgi:predicted DNA-binding transcriptional regulator AlpA
VSDGDEAKVVEMDMSGKLLLKDTDVARALSLSRAMVAKLRDQGRLPLPIRLGRSVRWRQSELRAWTEAGCPTLDEWQKLKRVGR